MHLVEMLMQVKKTVIWLRKQNKPIREKSKTLGVAKSSIRYITEKKKALVCSATPSSLKGHRGKLKRIRSKVFMVKKQKHSQNLRAPR